MRPIRRASRQRGTVLMEFALTLPLLILIVMIVLEGSRLVRTHQILNNAAREGARLAVLSSSSTADVTNEVVTYAAQNGVNIPAAGVTINQSFLIPTGSGVAISASKVTVNYTYTMNYLGVLAWLGVPSSYPLTGHAVFRNFPIS